MRRDHPMRRRQEKRVQGSITTTRRSRDARHRTRLILERLEDRALMAVTPTGLPTWLEQGPGPILGGQAEGVGSGATANPVAGAIQAVAKGAGTSLYVGSTNGGVWKTDNHTAATVSWTAKTDTLASLAIASLAVVPGATTATDLIFAGTGNVSSAGIETSGGILKLGTRAVGIYRSPDGGTSWTRVGNKSGEMAGLAVTSIVPTSFGTGSSRWILAGAEDPLVRGRGGVYLSKNNGDTWEKQSGKSGSGLPLGSSSHVIAGTTNRFYAAVAGFFDSNRKNGETDDSALTQNKGIYRGNLDTTTGVLTWTKLTIPTALLSDDSRIKAQRILMATHVSGTTEALYVGVIDSFDQLGAVLRTEDGGTTWTRMETPFTWEVPRAGPTSGSRVATGPHPGRQGDTHFSIVADPTNKNIVYIGGDRQPLRTDEANDPNYSGATVFAGRLFKGDASIADTSNGLLEQWVPITHDYAKPAGASSGSAPHADSRGMLFVSSTRLIEVDDGGIYALDNPSTISIPGPIGPFTARPTPAAHSAWFSLGGNLRTGEIYSVAYDSRSNVIFAGLQDNGSAEQFSTFDTDDADSKIDRDRDGNGSISNNELWTWNGFDGGDGNVQVSAAGTGTNTFRFTIANDHTFFTRREFDSSGSLAGSFVTTGAPTGLTGDPNAVGIVPIAFVDNAITPSRMALGLEGMYVSAAAGDYGQNMVLVESIPTVPERAKYVRAIAYGGKKGTANFDDVLYWARGSHVMVRDAGSGHVTAVPGVTPSISRTVKVEDPAAGKKAGLIIDMVLDPEDWERVFVTDGDRIFQSSDAGRTWKLMPNMRGLSRIQTITAVRIPDATGTRHLVLLAAGAGGVYRTVDPSPTDNSATAWFRYGAGLPNVMITDVKYDATDKVLIAGTFGRGAWSVAGADQTLIAPVTIEVTAPTSGTNTIIVRRSSTNPLVLEIVVGTQGSTFPLGSVQSIVIRGSAASDKVTLDASFGVPRVPGGIDFKADSNGVGGTDELILFSNNGKTYTTATALAEPSGSVGLRTTGGDTLAVFYSGVENASNSLPFDPILAKAAEGIAKAAKSTIADVNTAVAGLGDTASRWLGFESGVPPSSKPLPKKKKPLVSAAPLTSGLAAPLIERLLTSEFGTFSLEDLGDSITDLPGMRQALDDLDAIPNNVTLTEVNGVMRLEIGVERRIDGVTDLAVEGLGGLLALGGSVQISGRVRLNLTIGVDAEGFFLDANASATPEIVIDQLEGEAEGSGRVGFLGVTLKPSAITFDPAVRITINLTDPATQADDGRIRIDEFDPDLPTNGYMTVAVEGGPAGGTPDVTLAASFQVLLFQASVFDDVRLDLSWADVLDPTTINVLPAAGSRGQRLLEFIDTTSGPFLAGLNTFTTALEGATGLDVLDTELPVLNRTLGELINGNPSPLPVPLADIEAVPSLVTAGDLQRFTVRLKATTPAVVRQGIAIGQQVTYLNTAGETVEATICDLDQHAFTVQLVDGPNHEPAADPQLTVVRTTGGLSGLLRGISGLSDGLTVEIPTLQDLVTRLGHRLGIDDLAQRVRFVEVEDPSAPGGTRLDAIELVFDYTPEPLEFETSFDLSDQIAGLRLSASGLASVIVETSFHVAIGVRLGDVPDLTQRLYLVEDETEELALDITLSLDDPNLVGSIGFLDVRLAEAGVAAGDPADPSNLGITIAIQAGVQVNDPGPDGGQPGRVTMAELGDPLSVLSFPIEGSLDIDGLELSASVGTVQLASLGIVLDGEGDGHVGSLGDLAALPGKLLDGISGQIADFTDFNAITPQQILDALEALIDQLTAIGAGGIFQREIPLVNVSLAELIDLGQNLLSDLGDPADIETAAVSTAGLLEDLLNSKLGANADVEVHVETGQVVIVFTYRPTVLSRTLPFGIDLGGGRSLAALDGEGKLELSTTGTQMRIGLGIRSGASDSFAERIFLDTTRSGIHVQATANAGFGSGQAFDFKASVGPFELGIDNARGFFAVSGDLSFGGPEAADSRLTLAEIGQAISNGDVASLIDGSVTIDVQASLPIDGFDADGAAPALRSSIPAGSTDALIEIAGRLTNVLDPQFQFETGGAGLFTSVGVVLTNPPIDTIAVRAHNLDALISSGFLNFGTLVEGLEQLIAWGQDVLGVDLLNFKIPLVGKSLGDAFDFFNGTGGGGTLRTLVDQLKSAPTSAFAPNGTSAAVDAAINLIRTKLASIPGVEPIADIDNNQVLNAQDLLRIERTGGVATGIEALIAFRPSLNVPLFSSSFDLGTDFLKFSAEDFQVTFTGSLSVLLGFGVSKADGFFIRTDFSEFGLGSEPEFRVDGKLTVSGSPQLTLGFLKLGVDGGLSPSENFLEAQFLIDVNGGDPNDDADGDDADDGRLSVAEMLDLGQLGERISIRAPIEARIRAPLIVGVNSALPSLGATVSVDWSFDVGDGPIPPPTFAISEIFVDVGSFFSKAVRPLFERMQTLNVVPQQVLDVLNTELPLLNQTLFDVLIRPLPENKQKVARFLFNIASVISETQINASLTNGMRIEFAAPIPVRPDPATQLGSTNLAMAEIPDGVNEGGSVGGDDQADTPDAPGAGLPLIGSFIEDLAEIGITFPALRLSNLMKLFTGGDLDLVLVNLEELEASKEFNIEVPIFSAGIPYVAEVYIAAFFGGGFHLRADISAGLDTSGLRRGSFLSGIYLGDFDPGANGQIDPDDDERPELTLTADVHAGIDAGVRLLGLPVGSATGTVRLEANISVDLNDDNKNEDGIAPDPRSEADKGDGKLHFHEIPIIVQSNEGNPFCLFDLSGALTAALDLRLYVFLLFDETIHREYELLRFEHECDPQALPRGEIPPPPTDDDDPDDPFETVDLANLRGTALELTFAGTTDSKAAAGTDSETGDVIDVVLEDLDANVFNGPAVLDLAGSAYTLAPGNDADEFVITGLGDPQFLVAGVEFGQGVEYIAGGQARTGTVVEATNGTIRVRRSDAGTGGPGQPDAGTAITVRSGKETVRVRKGAWFERFGPLESGANFLSDSSLLTEVSLARGLGAGNDRLTVDPLIDASVSVRGGSGNDTLIGGSGPNTLIGGSGDDDLSVALAPRNLPATARLARSSDLRGEAGNDRLTGGVGDDTLLGGEGDDLIDAGFGIFANDGTSASTGVLGLGSGNDTLVGGGGLDQLSARDGADRVVGDYDLTFGGLPSATARREGRDLIDGGSGDDRIWGDNSDPTDAQDGPAPGPISGTDDTIAGGEGNDLIFAGPGNDYVDADPFGEEGGDPQGTDSVHAGAGNDTIMGRAGNDLLVGGPGSDTILGAQGADQLFGGDAVVGPAVNAGGSLAPAQGQDVLEGGDGSDLLDASDSEFATLRGGAGDDSLMGSRGSDWIDGGGERDILIGGPRDDRLVGNSGDDDVIGGKGRVGTFEFPTSLPGTNGADVVVAGPGADVVVSGNGFIGGFRSPTPFGSTPVDRTLDASGFGTGVVVDLNSTATQTISPGQTLRIGDRVEHFLGSPHADTVTVRPLSAPRTLIGGGGLDGLNLDALAQGVVLGPTTIEFRTASGEPSFAPVTVREFATIGLTNTNGRVTIRGDVRDSDLVLQRNGTTLTFRLDGGAVVTVAGVSSVDFEDDLGNDSAALTLIGGNVTLRGGAGTDGLTGTLTGAEVVLSDAFNLGSTLSTGASAASSRLVGPLVLTTGPHALVVNNGAAADDLVVASPLQGAGELVKQGAGTLVLNGSSPVYSGVLRVAQGLARVDGSMPAGSVIVDGGTLGGSGAVGFLDAVAGVVDPGPAGSTGVLAVQDGLALGRRATFSPMIRGTVPGSGFDQLNVQGRVSLAGATFNPIVTASTTVGSVLILIANDGSDPVLGTFAGLEEGAVLELNRVKYGLSYRGGSGANDVTLTHLNSLSMFPQRRITPRVEEGGVAVLEGRIGDLDLLDPFLLEISWGDGTPLEVIEFPGGSPREVRIEHRYADDGSGGSGVDRKIVRLRWSDPNGSSNSGDLAIEVANRAPAILALQAAGPVLEGAETTLLGRFEEPADPVTVEVDWGDGSPVDRLAIGVGQPLLPTGHRYGVGGTYTITATIRDDDGGTAVGQTTVEVQFTSPNRAIVAGLYREILGRAPSQDEVVAWSRRLDSGTRPTVLVRELSRSLEARTVAINRLYQSYLRRPATSTELARHLRALRSGRTLATIRLDLLASEEYFRERGGSQRLGFVEALYQDLRGTPVPASQRVRLTARGLSRRSIAQWVLARPSGPLPLP